MVKKKNIRRVLLAILWIAMVGGVVVLLVAAIGKKNNGQCKGIEIDINAAGENYFVNKKDVMNVISPDGSSINGKSITEFDLRKIEETLGQNTWIKDVELFFDNKSILNVRVDERIPIARVFTVGGNTFYIDSAIKKLPVSNKASVKLPVFTGFPTNAQKLNKDDSMLLQQIKQISLFIAKDTFWTAQIAQIDITPLKTFEMIPVVGTHIIQFGDGENCEAKFNRLMIFYKRILPKVGFNKYAYINVQYEKQVIGTRKGEDSRIDSLQALKNIQQMLLAAKRMQSDSLAAMQMPARQLQPETLRDSTLSLIDTDSSTTKITPKPAKQVKPPETTRKQTKPAGKPPVNTPKPGSKPKGKQ